MRIYQAKGTIFHTLQTIMVPIGYLSGHQTHWEVARDEQLKPFIRNVLHKEIVPSIHPFGDQGWTVRTIFRYEDLDARHTLVEVPESPSFKDWENNLHAGFTNLVIPCILDYYYGHRQSRLPLRLVFSLAALTWFYKDYALLATDKASSQTIRWIRQLWSAQPHTTNHYQQLAANALGYEAYWKQELNAIPGLTAAVAYHLTYMHKMGFSPALQQVARV